MILRNFRNRSPDSNPTELEQQFKDCKSKIRIITDKSFHLPKIAKNSIYNRSGASSPKTGYKRRPFIVPGPVNNHNDSYFLEPVSESIESITRDSPRLAYESSQTRFKSHSPMRTTTLPNGQSPTPSRTFKTPQRNLPRFKNNNYSIVQNSINSTDLTTRTNNSNLSGSKKMINLKAISGQSERKQSIMIAEGSTYLEVPLENPAGASAISMNTSDDGSNTDSNVRRSRSLDPKTLRKRHGKPVIQAEVAKLNFNQRTSFHIKEAERNKFKNILPKPWKPRVFRADNSFKLTNSIFSKFNMEEPEDIESALDTDLDYCRLKKFLGNNQDEVTKLRNFLLDFGYYLRILNIFRYYQSFGSFPKASAEDFLELIKEQAKVIDRRFRLTDFAAIVKEVKSGHRANDKDYMRYEFLELLVRLAVFKYKNSGLVEDYHSAITIFLDTDFLPYAKDAEYEYNGLRIEKIFTSEMDRAMKKTRAYVEKVKK